MLLHFDSQRFSSLDRIGREGGFFAERFLIWNNRESLKTVELNRTIIPSPIEEMRVLVSELCSEERDYLDDLRFCKSLTNEMRDAFKAIIFAQNSTKGLNCSSEYVFEQARRALVYLGVLNQSGKFVDQVRKNRSIKVEFGGNARNIAQLPIEAIRQMFKTLKTPEGTNSFSSPIQIKKLFDVYLSWKEIRLLISSIKHLSVSIKDQDSDLINVSRKLAEEIEESKSKSQGKISNETLSKFLALQIWEHHRHDVDNSKSSKDDLKHKTDCDFILRPIAKLRAILKTGSAFDHVQKPSIAEHVVKEAAQSLAKKPDWLDPVDCDSVMLEAA